MGLECSAVVKHPPGCSDTVLGGSEEVCADCNRIVTVRFQHKKECCHSIMVLIPGALNVVLGVK